MWQRISSWIRGKPSAATPQEIRSLTGVRTRNPRPVHDRALRRAASDWPGAGESPTIIAPRLGHCRTWIYQLQSINWERIEASISDVAVIDASIDGSEAGAFSAGQVDRMRTKPGGGITAVLCYLSIGAAEPWRFYWNGKWQRARPGWMAATPGEWAGSQLVHYWDSRWQALLVDQPGSLIDRVLAAGYDGVVLDGVDAFEHFRARGRANAPDEMIDLVARIGARAWQTNPDFLVVPLNGEELLGSPRYRSTISAVLREDTLFRLDYASGRETVVENSDKIVAGIMGDLKLALADGIPVLGVEYLRDDAADEARIPMATRRLRGMGLVPYFAPRRLDRLCPPPY